MPQSRLLQRQHQDNDNNNRRAPKRPRRKNNGGNAAAAAAATDDDDSTPKTGREYQLLPDDVLEKIFSFLPIKQAVRNAVVSKSLAKAWVLSRDLTFEREVSRRIRTRSKLVNIVNGVFEAHKGPEIKTFRLYFNHPHVDHQVQRWLETVIAKGVEELDLDFDLAAGQFDYPLDFLGVQTLRTLRLINGHINNPTRGFNTPMYLKTVVLKKVSMSQWVVSTLVRQCPGLESLSVTQCYVFGIRIYASELKNFRELRIGGCPGLSLVHVDAPSLVSFHYQGQCRTLSLYQSVSKLDDVILNFTPSKTFKQCYTDIERIANHHLRNVTVLSTTSTLLEGLPGYEVGIARRFLPNPWTELKELQLSMETNTFCNLTDVASFLASCTNLEKLFIDLNNYNFESGMYWELHQKQNLDIFETIFFRLKFVKISGYRFLKHEVELVRFLLQRSLKLEELVLLFPKGTGNAEVSLEHAYMCCCHFLACRLSRNATITVLDHYHDESCEPKHSKINWYK